MLRRLLSVGEKRDRVRIVVRCLKRVAEVDEKRAAAIKLFGAADGDQRASGRWQTAAGETRLRNVGGRDPKHDARLKTVMCGRSPQTSTHVENAINEKIGSEQLADERRADGFVRRLDASASRTSASARNRSVETATAICLPPHHLGDAAALAPGASAPRRLA